MCKTTGAEAAQAPTFTGMAVRGFVIAVQLFIVAPLMPLIVPPNAG